MQATIIQQILDRLTSQSPPFWNKIKAYSIYIILAIGIALGGEYLELYVLPGKVATLLYAVAAYFLGTGTAAAITKKDASDDGDTGPGGVPTQPPTKPPKP